MKIKLLTPVHIGTGYEIPFYEWKADSSNNRWVRIDLLNLPCFPPDDVLRDFDKLKAWRENLTWDDVLKCKIYEAKVSERICLPTQGTEIFRECIKNQSTLQPIIPGSSLKGTISTGYQYWEKDLNGRIDEKELELFAHRLKISDIVFPQSALRIDLAERRMKKAGNKYQWVECIAAGAVGIATISFGSERDFAYEVAPQMRPLRRSDVEKLVKRCNHFAKAVIKAEVEYYDYVRKHRVTLPNHYEKYSVDFVDNLPAMECLVRVGWGSSKNAVSLVLLNSAPNLAYQPRPSSERYRPKSRWLLSGNIPPGWCLLKFEKGDWVE